MLISLRAWWTRLRAEPAPARDGRLTDVYLAACLALIPLTVLARAFLPARFSYDSGALQRIAVGSYVPLQDPSYLYVGRAYGWLGLGERPWAAAALGLAMAAVALYPALVAGRGTPGLLAYALLGLYVVTASVYLGQYSKDVWVVPVVLAVLLAPRGLAGELLILVVGGLYAWLLRDYWFLILAIYVLLRLVTAPALRTRRVVAVVVGVVLVMTLIAPVVLGVELQHIRDSINDDRVLSADAATAISAPELGGGVAGDVVENIAVLGGLLVPVPLLLKGSPVYAVYAVAILLIWVALARSATRGPRPVLDGRPASTGDVRSVRATLFTVAVVTTQSFFEPDYGSFLRHLTPVLLLVIAMAVGRRGSPLVVPPAAEGPSRSLPPSGYEQSRIT